jgi:hypothetical protein
MNGSGRAPFNNDSRSPDRAPLSIATPSRAIARAD